jgi:GNAT superfamily N-acetyltransferase
MNFVWVDENNKDAFKSVLPGDLTKSLENVCLCGCDDDGNVLGSLCYSYASYEFDILWLYTKEEHRRQGVATRLMDKMLEIAAFSGEIFPISAVFEPGRDESLYSFFLAYEKMDTEFSHSRFYVTPRDIRGAKLPSNGSADSFEKKEFFSLPDAVQNNILHKLMSEYGYVIADFDDFRESTVSKLCRCILREDVLLDLIFVQKRPDDNLELSFLLGENKKGLIELLTTTAWDIEDLFPESKLVFDAVTEESLSMAKKLFPWSRPIPVYEARW